MFTRAGESGEVRRASRRRSGYSPHWRRSKMILAACLATPLTVVRRGKGDLSALASLAAAEEAMEILVGLPRSLSGRRGPGRHYREAVRGGPRRSSGKPFPVQLVDEGITTSTAHGALATARHIRRRGGRRSTRPPPRCCSRRRSSPSAGTGAPPGDLVTPRPPRASADEQPGCGRGGD